MDYDLKTQLDRIEQSQIEIMTELGILNAETGEYVPYEEREGNQEETEGTEEDKELPEGKYNIKSGKVEPKENVHQMKSTKSTIG